MVAVIYIFFGNDSPSLRRILSINSSCSGAANQEVFVLMLKLTLDSDNDYNCYKFPPPLQVGRGAEEAQGEGQTRQHRPGSARGQNKGGYLKVNIEAKIGVHNRKCWRPR